MDGNTFLRGRNLKAPDRTILRGNPLLTGAVDARARAEKKKRNEKKKIRVTNSQRARFNTSVFACFIAV
jgi:hypothetical protein